MPKLMRPFARLAFTALGPVLVAGAALAGEDNCRVPMADWQPREAVQALAEAQGLTVRRIKIDDGCYEVHARDAQGRDVEMTLDPATLAVVDSEFEGDHEAGHEGGHDRSPDH